MHIKNHRHFLAAPAFIAALAAVMALGSENLTSASLIAATAGSEMVAQGADREFTLPSSVSGILREDGILVNNGASLSLEGTALFFSRGLITVDAGDIRLTGFRGGFTVTKNGTKLAVLALTTPVLLERGDFRLMIPAGMQGQWEDLDVLPEEFSIQDLAVEIVLLEILPRSVAREERAALAELNDVPLPAFDTIAHTPLLAAFALPAAKERLQEESRNADLELLRGALEEKDIGKSLGLLRDDEVRETACSQAREGFSVLLSLAARIPSAALELLQCAHVDLWLLASLHPEYRRAAWETSGPLNIGTDARMQRWLQLPSSDVGQAIPKRVIDQWQQQLEKHLKTAAHSEEFLEALLFSAQTYRDVAEENLPARAERYHRALAQLVEPYEASLTEEGKQYWEEWQSLEEIPAYAEPPAPVPQETPEKETSEEDIPEEPFDPATVEAQVKKILQDAGALFTINTTITAESAKRAAVSGVLFASEEGEHQYEFILDIVAKELSAIKRDGELQPYPLSLEGFVEWAKE